MSTPHRFPLMPVSGMDNHETGTASSLKGYNHGKVTASLSRQSRTVRPSRRDHHRNHPPRSAILPSWILHQIFIACARLSVHDLHWSWVTVSFVCSSWRNAALACPELWSHIDFSHPKRTALTLQRAKTLSLSIRAAVGDHNIKRLHHILRDTSRIHEIDLSLSAYDFQRLMDSLTAPNDHLKSLRLNITDLEDSYEISYHKSSSRAVDSIALPATLPALKYLELHRSPFSFVSNSSTSLTQLSLHHLPRSEQPELRTFLLAFARLPMLEHLTLVEAFPKLVVPGSPADTGRCFRMPRLVQLSLRGKVQDLSQMLKHLILPPTTRLRCTVSKPCDSQTEFRKLAKSIEAHLANSPASSPFESVVVTGWEASYRFLNNHKPNPKFRQSLRLRALRADSGWENVALDLAFGPDSLVSDELVSSWLTTIWKILPLQHAHTLALQNVDVLTQRTWYTLLRGLDSVRVVEINGHPPAGLLWSLLLNAKSHSPLDDDCDDIFLPQLTDVHLYDVDCFGGGFMISSTVTENSHCDLDDSKFVDVLLVYLQERLRHSIGLRSLSLFQCSHICPKTLRALRERVHSLFWDHNGTHDESGESDSLSAAHYRRTWAYERPDCRHFHRLFTLLQGQL